MRRRHERVWLLLLAVTIAVLVIGWLLVRGERDGTQPGSRAEVTASTTSAPPVSSQPAPPPRTELTQQPPVSDQRDRILVHGKVSSPDHQARLAGEVDITYWDQDREDEQHAIATIQPDHTFRLTLPRGVHLRRA